MNSKRNMTGKKKLLGHGHVSVVKKGFTPRMIKRKEERAARKNLGG
tara:strand:+ start:198 stop:335 length:138 start_codon:yes stop_codon:yes gene_type:complete